MLNEQQKKIIEAVRTLATGMQMALDAFNEDFYELVKFDTATTFTDLEELDTYGKAVKLYFAAQHPVLDLMDALKKYSSELKEGDAE